MAFMMDAQKDLDEGIQGSAPVGMLYYCIGSDGRIRGCPDQPGRYDEGCLRDRRFEEIWRGGFRRYWECRMVNEDESCVGYGCTASGKLWKTGSVHLFIKKCFYPIP